MRKSQSKEREVKVGEKISPGEQHVHSDTGD